MEKQDVIDAVKEAMGPQLGNEVQGRLNERMAYLSEVLRAATGGWVYGKENMELKSAVVKSMLELITKELE